MYFSQLSRLPSIQIVQQNTVDVPISHLLTDSRKLIVSEGALFFAISGARHDAHQYITAVYNAGIRMFVVENLDKIDLEQLPQANIVLAHSAIHALQEIAAAHRESFDLEVLAITGSNAKTTIKEYLAQMLEGELQLVKSPKSYNSQIGVPLSVWMIGEEDTLGIFEAGISTVGEMENLERVIQPTVGLFTNIGTAHDEGFTNIQEKIRDKLQLFRHVNTLIYRRDHEQLHQEITQLDIPTFTWTLNDATADVKISKAGEYEYDVYHEQQVYKLQFPASDAASVENIAHCVAFLIYKGFSAKQIATALKKIKKVAMRLELKQGHHNCYLIDDTYNNDLAGLQVALEFLAQQHMRSRKSIIISDLIQAGNQPDKVYADMGKLLQSYPLHQIHAIGMALYKHKHLLPSHAQFYATTEDFLNQLQSRSFEDEIILVKGARSFAFERIVEKLQQKTHSTVLEINLEALAHNLNYYKSKLQKGTKVMAMVKAFAYGSGSFEVAQLLQYHKVDYLGVAYTQEAIDLRNHGITMPIMVMNASKDNFEDIMAYQLEPEIYSFEVLADLIAYTHAHKKSKVRIHLDIDTGMRRLGFELEDLGQLLRILSEQPQLEVVSVFSHLVGADEMLHDDFSKSQIQRFKGFASAFEEAYGKTVLKHICNSAGIVAYPEAQMDMVRLGVGLYGIEATQQEQSKLRAVSTLKSVIAQIKHVGAGETVGYGRRGKAEASKTIATINIGYADGYSRAFSRGVGQVLVHGQKAPIIGNICMDMCMIDITGIEAQVGDEVILFGEQLSIIDLAKAIGTIPYEILTNVSERVKRVFYMV